MFPIDAVDPWQLVRAVPSHRTWRAWRGPNGDFHLAVGHAWRMSSSGRNPAVDLGDLGQMLKGAVADSAQSIATISVAFDPKRTHQRGDAWRDFAPMEISVPEVLFRRIRGVWTLSIVANEDRLETVERGARAIHQSALSAMEPHDHIQGHVEFGAYRAEVQRALEALHKEEVSKIVIARKAEFKAESEIDHARVLRRLDERFPNCFVFAHRAGGSQSGPGAVFLGASPERLVSCESGTLHTEALAGSVGVGDSDSERVKLARGLMESEKDLREHHHVVDYIREILSPITSGFELGELGVKSLKNVQHLHTPIRAKLREGATILDAVKVLHPTSAVGGSPRERALELIAEIEGFDRGWYAGALGWMGLGDSTDGELTVAIRSAMIRKNIAELYAGAGIVVGSDPVAEDQETRVKMRALLEALE